MAFCDLCNNNRTQPSQTAGGHVPLHINNKLICNGSCPWCYECCLHYCENQTNDCPTCLRKYDRELYVLMDSPANSGFDISCNHWQCHCCWATGYNTMQYNCPFCNEDLKAWMESEYCSENGDGDSSENGDGDSSELEMNCDILLPK